MHIPISRRLRECVGSVGRCGIDYLVVLDGLGGVSRLRSVNAFKDTVSELMGGVLGGWTAKIAFEKRELTETRRSRLKSMDKMVVGIGLGEGKDWM
jgi:hypothetical protein